MLDIVDNKPLTFSLWGFYGEVANERFGEVGFKLMNEMWSRLKSSDVRSDGTNHWVYLDKKRMFVGVGLIEGETAPPGFEHIEFELGRYLRHKHVGAYEHLPVVWKRLMDGLQSQGETASGPSIEVYGHQSKDPTKLPETTILISLQ